MRHRNGLKKIGRNSSHRKATLRNMATALFEHERIITTAGKARALRPFAERLITMAKVGDLDARRRAAGSIQDQAVLKKLFDDLGDRFATRNGGYTRILRLGARRGDNAPQALVELVDRREASTPAEATPE
jgi:large subunit ribosomal protein L17